MSAQQNDLLLAAAPDDQNLTAVLYYTTTPTPEPKCTKSSLKNSSHIVVPKSFQAIKPKPAIGIEIYKIIYNT